MGTTDAESCMDQVPNHCPSVCSTPDAAKLGIMMSTFSKKRGKMDGQDRGINVSTLNAAVHFIFAVFLHSEKLSCYSRSGQFHGHDLRKFRQRIQHVRQKSVCYRKQQTVTGRHASELFPIDQSDERP